jgi:hypothetical protein
MRATKDAIACLTNLAQEGIVSEHALLRFLERVHGIDMQRVRKTILPREIAESIKTLGTGHYRVDVVDHNHQSVQIRLRVKKNVVTTLRVEDEA